MLIKIKLIFLSTNNKEITKNINGNYIVYFIDNKILNIVYTKYIFKNAAGYNNKYMIYESSSEVNFKKFSYIEFKLKFLFRYNKYRFIGAIKICITFCDKDGNEIYIYQELLTNSGDNYAEKIYNKNDFTFILNDDYENIYYKIFLMDDDISKIVTSETIELALLDELDIFQNILTLKSFMRI